MNLELGLGACALFSFIFFCGFSLILWLIVAVKESLRDYDLDYGVIFVILIVLGIVMGTLTTYKLSGFTEQHPDSVEKKS